MERFDLSCCPRSAQGMQPSGSGYGPEYLYCPWPMRLKPPVLCKRGSGPEWPGTRNGMQNWTRRSRPERTGRDAGHQNPARLGRTHVTKVETRQWIQEG